MNLTILLEMTLGAHFSGFIFNCVCLVVLDLFFDSGWPIPFKWLIRFSCVGYDLVHFLFSARNHLSGDVDPP